GTLGYPSIPHVGRTQTPASAGSVSLGGPTTELSLGIWHTCARLEAGPMCWGYNGNGQLGYNHLMNIGDTETPASAGTFDPGGPASQLAPGYQHTCSRRLDTGAVRCWGYNWYG